MPRILENQMNFEQYGFPTQAAPAPGMAYPYLGPATYSNINANGNPNHGSLRSGNTIGMIHRSGAYSRMARPQSPRNATAYGSPLRPPTAVNAKELFADIPLPQQQILLQLPQSHVDMMDYYRQTAKDPNQAMRHAAGVYCILQQWNCCPTICVLGLIRAMYGLENGLDRAKIRCAVGDYVDIIAHAMSQQDNLQIILTKLARVAALESATCALSDSERTIKIHPDDGLVLGCGEIVTKLRTRNPSPQWVMLTPQSLYDILQAEVAVLAHRSALHTIADVLSSTSAALCEGANQAVSTVRQNAVSTSIGRLASSFGLTDENILALKQHAVTNVKALSCVTQEQLQSIGISDAESIMRILNWKAMATSAEERMATTTMSGAIARLPPATPEAELPKGVCIRFHWKELPGFDKVWAGLEALFAAFKSPLDHMGNVYNPNMVWHWNNVIVPERYSGNSPSNLHPNMPAEALPGELRDLYDSRESLDMTGKLCAIVGTVDGPSYWDKLKNPNSTAVYSYGGAQLMRTSTVWPNENYQHEVCQNRPVGISHPYYDLIIKFPDGWQVRNGKLELKRVSMTESKFSAIEESLMELFGSSFVDFRGCFHYPRMAFREWHTNRLNPPGWRLYMIKCDEDEMSQFAFRDPSTGKVYRVADFNGCINMFRVNNDPEQKIWHCIYSMTQRYSFGFHVTDYAAEKIIQALESKRGLPIGALGRPFGHEPDA